MTQDDQMAKDVAQIRKDVDSILHGNGRKGVWALADAVFGAYGKNDPGLVGQVKTLVEAQGREDETRTTIKDIRDKVDALEKARAKDENLREGGRRVLITLGTIVTILSGLGATFGWRVLQTVGELATQLP